MQNKNLTGEQQKVLFEEATEPPFTGKYWNEKRKGIYRCANCGTSLFSSEKKFDSGTGWPSFTDPMGKDVVDTKTDFKIVLPRTEVHCTKCCGHLGHVFNDGPDGCKRYCINSASLEFKGK